MKTSKIILRATELKAKGYKNMASVVKSHFDTTYYHVVSIDDVLSAGKWIPAGKVQFSSGAHGRVGISSKNIDWTITARK
jgi:hypothetical protein